ncbi:MAG: MMPL family transporter [Proteobacteria bacterium]|nr:MMPL family transporter [Pseudomonadota bacterium]
MPFIWRKRLFLLLLPVLLAATTWQVHLESDLNAFFTATDSEDSSLLAGFLQSGELSRRYLIMVEPGTALNAVELSHLPSPPTPLPQTGEGSEKPLSPLGIWVGERGLFTDEFIRQLAGLEAVERVWPAHEAPREWLAAVQNHAPYHARLYSLDPQEEGRALFDPGQLGKRAEWLQLALLSPQGGFIKPIAKQDPLLLSLNGFKSMQHRLDAQQRPGDVAGTLILQSRPAALDAEAQASLQDLIRTRFDALNGASGGGFRLRMTGIPTFTVAAQGEIKRDVTLVSIVSSIGVALVFLLLFRSFAALHWMLLIQTASFAAGALACALAFEHVHSLTLALGATLIGICTDYPMHVLVHCAKHRHTPAAAARMLWPSLLMGGLTTVIGYVAMGMTGFPGLEQIAVFAAASIAAALGLTRWVLPALLGKTSLHPAHLPGIGEWVGFCERRRSVLLGLFAVSVVAALAALAALPGLRWMDDLQQLAMDMGGMRREDDAIRAHFTSVEPGRFVLVQASDMETALQRSEAAELRLQKLKSSGDLTEYHGLFPWLASARLQAQNAATYNEALTPAFRDAWRVALLKTGLAVDKLASLPPASAKPLLPEAVLATPVRQILSGQIIEQKTGVALSIWLGKHDPGKLAESLAGLEGVRYFSQKDQLDRMARQHRDRSLDMLAVGVAVMSLFIWLQQRNAVKVLLTLLPALSAVLFIFAAWAVLGEEVSFLHVIGLLLSVSLCVDYGIFFMDNRGHDTDITYHAIASSTLTTLASFGALGLAKTPSLPILAVSVSLGVTLGFLLCPLLIRSESSKYN